MDPHNITLTFVYRNGGLPACRRGWRLTYNADDAIRVAQGSLVSVWPLTRRFGCFTDLSNVPSSGLRQVAWFPPTRPDVGHRPGIRNPFGWFVSVARYGWAKYCLQPL